MFSDILKKLREEKGIKQSDLATFLEISVQNISYYERGREPNYDTLKKIADYFNVTTDYLTGRSEFKTFEEELQHKNTLKKLGIKNDTLPLTNEDREKIINSINLLYNSLVEFFSSHASENDVSNSQFNGGDSMLGIILSLSSIINKCSTLYRFSAHTYEYRNLMNSLNIPGFVYDDDTDGSDQINGTIDSKAWENIRTSEEKLKEFAINTSIIQLTNVLLGLQNGIILDLSNIQKSYSPRNSYYWFKVFY